MDEELTELQLILLETNELDLPRRDAARLATQRAGYFIGQQRYTAELSKARRIIEANPNALERARLSETAYSRGATHQIGSSGG